MSKKRVLHWNRIYCMDALKGLKYLDDECVDLVVTDPPYNIASNSRTTMQNGVPISTLKAWGAWDQFHPFDYDVFIMAVISECYRILKPGGALYMFTAREHSGFFVRQAIARGFMYRNQLIMVKTNPLPSMSKSNWRSAFEICLYVSKGKPRTFSFVSQQLCKNVYSYANGAKKSKHPTEKPLAFIRQIVEVSSNPGDRVLDPFMGSGTTAVGCKELGRQYLGFDTSVEYVKMARERLKGVKAQRAKAA